MSGPGASGLNRVGFRVAYSADPSVAFAPDPDRRAAEYVLAAGLPPPAPKP